MAALLVFVQSLPCPRLPKTTESFHLPDVPIAKPAIAAVSSSSSWVYSRNSRLSSLLSPPPYSVEWQRSFSPPSLSPVLEFSRSANSPDETVSLWHVRCPSVWALSSCPIGSAISLRILEPIPRWLDFWMRLPCLWRRDMLLRELYLWFFIWFYQKNLRRMSWLRQRRCQREIGSWRTQHLLLLPLWIGRVRSTRMRTASQSWSNSKYVGLAMLKVHTLTYFITLVHRYASDHFSFPFPFPFCCFHTMRLESCPVSHGGDWRDSLSRPYYTIQHSP